MKYVFIDTEGEVDQKSGLKTLGLAVFDENFAMLEKREVFIEISPNGAKRKNRKMKTDNPVNKIFCILRDYLTAPDSFVLGFSVLQDVRHLNRACERAKTPPLAFGFFDVQKLYSKLFPEENQPSLSGCVKSLGIDEKFEYHKSEEDAYATARVMQKLCERENTTIAGFIEKYPEFAGRTEMYMASFAVSKRRPELENSSVNLFKIRIDFPLIYFKKQIGAINKDGVRDGKSIYYDPVLDMLFEERHPFKVSKAGNNCIVGEHFNETDRLGRERLRKFKPQFYHASAPMETRKYIVSYECVGRINGGCLDLMHGNKYLKRASGDNPYVKKVLGKGRDGNELIRKYYTADAFETVMRRNAKWNYGDKNPAIVLGAPLPAGSLRKCDGDEYFLPRVYAGTLTGAMGGNETVACPKEHMEFASAQNVLDIATLDLPDNAIRLVAKDEDGKVWALIPVEYGVKFSLLGGRYELPLIVRRELPDDFFATAGP